MRASRQHFIDGPEIIILWAGAGRVGSLPNGPSSLKQHAAHRDDGFVTGAQMLLAPVNDGAHAFLDSMVLRVDPLDAAVAQHLLRLAIDHPVIVFVSSLAEIGGAVLRSSARAPFKLVAPLHVYRRLSKTIYPVVDHTVFIIHGHPHVTSHERALHLAANTHLGGPQ